MDEFNKTNVNNSRKSHRAKLKSKRLRARLSHTNENADQKEIYLEHLRKTKNHNLNFKKLTQKIKQMARNVNCPKLKPLSFEEKKLIINTVS